MNYKTLVKGALALSLSLIVGSASASTTTTNDVQKYGAMFETTANTPVGAFNDNDYEVGSNITAYADATTGVGWFSGDAESDESKIIARTDAAGGQALQLNTDASTLTNKFSSTLAGELNTGIAAAGAYFETEVKFVPSDTLDAGITGGQDATKFAIYAYANEDVDPPVTNLVVFHAYQDYNDDSLAENNYIGYTNEIFDVDIDATEYVNLRVEMKKGEIAGNPVNLFSVKVGNAASALTSDLAFEGDIWFLTVENRGNDNNANVSSLNFKGTGEIDNIKAGVITTATTYAINFVDEDGTTSLFSTNVPSGNGVYYYGEAPTKAATVASNFTFAAWSPAFADGDTASADATYTATYTAAVRSYTITWVIDGVSETTTVAYGETPTHAAPEKAGYDFTGWTPAIAAVTGEATYTATFEEQQGSDDYAANDTVGGVTISAGMATWLNGLKGNATKADFENSFDNDDLSLTEEYLLNTDPTVATTIAFNISSIAVGNTVDLNVALTRTENNAAVESAINGQLQILGAATVDGSYNATNALPAAKFSGGAAATTSLTTQSKFFKAVIVEAPAVQE